MFASPIRILLVEDSRLQREIMRSALTRFGYQVEGANTGEEALQQYAPGRYDVLLVDVLMPGIGGVEVLQQVRAQDPDQCIILMTAEGSGISPAEAIRAGADDYISKPMNLQNEGVEMEAVVQRAMDYRKLTREKRALQAQLLEIEQLHATMGLMGTAAREMNQPLTVMIGALDLLTQGAHAEEQPEVEMLMRAIQRMGELVKRLCALTDVHGIGDPSSATQYPAQETP
jgi:DNA-binding response OmpR family regulator